MPSTVASMLQSGGESPPPNPQQGSGLATPPAQGAPAGLLQSMLRGGPNVPGTAAPGGMQPAQQAPAPNQAQTVAAVRHLGEFMGHWKKLATDPAIGKKNMKSDIYDMMADVMGEGLVTLPQVMKELQAVPDEPLQQKQWVDQHLAKTRMAIDQVLDHHAAANPGVGPWPVEQAKIAATAAQQPPHADMMSDVAGHYAGRARRNA